MRYPDWPHRLNEFVVAATKREFRWAEHDCCTFAADAVLAITGVDYMADFRGRYHDEESAEALITAECRGGSLFKHLYKLFGRPVHGAMAQRGDIAWYEGCCGVMVSNHAVFFGQNGYLLVPRRRKRPDDPYVKFAFRVR